MVSEGLAHCEGSGEEASFLPHPAFGGLQCPLGCGRGSFLWYPASGGSNVPWLMAEDPSCLIQLLGDPASPGLWPHHLSLYVHCYVASFACDCLLF